MARGEELTDEHWAVIEPQLPELPRREDGRGRPWRANRAVINGIAVDIACISVASRFCSAAIYETASSYSLLHASARMLRRFAEQFLLN